MSEEREPPVLGYGRLETRDLPLFAQFILGAAWFSIIFITYTLAITAPLSTIVGLYFLITESSVHPFAEPIETTWQKVSFVAYAAGMTVIFTPLAIWLSVRIRRDANAPDRREVSDVRSNNWI